MPPIWRGADRAIRTTRDMQWGVEAVLWWILELENNGFDPIDRAADYDDAEIAARFVQSPSGIQDAHVFSVVRNLLDIELINGGCETTAEPDVECDFCMWCQALILRDWMDSLMDQAGCHRSSRVAAFLGDEVCNPAGDEARWGACNCGTHTDVAEETA